MEILFKNAQRKIRINSKGIKNNVKQVLEDLDCHEKELSILVVSDAKIRELNRQYRGMDRATDVLSFPQQEEDNGLNHHLLGDIVFSAETAARQAKEHGLSFEEEILLLLIHGILHLLGYDHERSKKNEKQMRKKSRELFGMLFPGKEPADSCNF